jgi:hypothetical protein
MSYQPTEEIRQRVKMLAGLGIRQAQICVLVDLRSLKTLRRYFAKELSLGIAESSTRVLQTLFKRATSRRDPKSTIFWLKTRAGWSPDMTAAPETERDEQLIFVYEDYKLPVASEQT